MKDYFKIAMTVFAIFIFNTCGTTQVEDCIDESKINDGACTLEYDPVCGCDNKTYGNACAAERSGVTRWEMGECIGDN